MSQLVDLARAHGGAIRWHEALAALRELPELDEHHDARLGEWFVSLCEAVAERHAAAAVVGDLDPRCVTLVVHGDDVEARIVERADDAPPSPFHASPARLDADDDTPPTPADDVYALGVLLYEGLTLQRPFVGTGRAPLRTEVRRGVPTDPRALRPVASPGLSLVALAAMARRPSRRPDAAALAADARAALAGSVPDARGPSPLARLVATLRRRPLAALGRALVAVGLVGSLALTAWTSTLVRDAERRASEAVELATERGRIADEHLAAAERHRAEAEAAVERWREASEARRAAAAEEERARLAAAEAAAEAELARIGRERTAWTSYVTTVRGAASALAAGDADGARELLERCPDELRDWLWDHVAWRLDPASSWRLPWPVDGADVGPAGLVAWADGKLVVAAHTGDATPLSLPDDVAAVTSACWLPPGVEGDVLVGDARGAVHVLRIDGDVVTRAARWEGRPSRVTSLAASAASGSGRRAVVGHADGVLAIRGLADGALQHTCVPVGATPPVTALALAPSGDRVAARSTDGVVLWDAATGRALDVLPAPVGGVAFAPDGRRLVVAGEEALEFWDARRGDRLGAALLPTGGRAVAVVDGGATVLVGGDDGAWRVVSVADLAVTSTTPGHRAPIVALRAVEDGRVVTVAADGAVRSASRALAGPCAVQLGGPAQRLAVQGDRLVVTSASGDVALLDARTGHVLATRPGQAAAALDHAATTLVTTDRGGVARLWSARDGRELGEVPLGVGRVEALAVAPDAFGGGAGSSVRTLAVATTSADGVRGVQVLAVDPTGGQVDVLGRFDVDAAPTASLDFDAEGALIRRAYAAPPRRWRWEDGAIVEGTALPPTDPRRRLTRDGERAVDVRDGVARLRARAPDDVVLATWTSPTPIVAVAVTGTDTVVTLSEAGRLEAHHRRLDEALAWCEAAARRRALERFVGGLAAEGLSRDAALTRIAEHPDLDEPDRAAARSLVITGWTTPDG